MLQKNKFSNINKVKHKLKCSNVQFELFKIIQILLYQKILKLLGKKIFILYFKYKIFIYVFIYLSKYYFYVKKLLHEK